MTLKIKGRPVVEGLVEGKAVVAFTPLSFTYIDAKTGRVIDPNHELNGKKISEKVLFLPSTKGSAMQPFSFRHLVNSRVAPLALVACEVDLRLMVSALYGEIPMIDLVDRELFSKVKSGDRVKVDAERGLVEVYK